MCVEMLGAFLPCYPSKQGCPMPFCTSNIPNIPATHPLSHDSVYQHFLDLEEQSGPTFLSTHSAISFSFHSRETWNQVHFISTFYKPGMWFLATVSLFQHTMDIPGRSFKRILLIMPLCRTGQLKGSTNHVMRSSHLVCSEETEAGGGGQWLAPGKLVGDWRAGLLIPGPALFHLKHRIFPILNYFHCLYRKWSESYLLNPRGSPCPSLLKDIHSFGPLSREFSKVNTKQKPQRSEVSGNSD